MRSGRRAGRISRITGLMTMSLLLALPAATALAATPKPTPTPTHSATPTPTPSHTITPTPSPTTTTPPAPYHTNLSLTFNISSRAISITIVGTGFLPGAQVSIDLNAGTFHQHLGLGTADSHGTFTATVSVPLTLPKGAYTLQAAGIGSDANARLLSANLNFTGHGIAGVSNSHMQWLIDGAIGALAAAMVLFVALRRRRHKAEQAS